MPQLRRVSGNAVEACNDDKTRESSIGDGHGFSGSAVIRCVHSVCGVADVRAVRQAHLANISEMEIVVCGFVYAWLGGWSDRNGEVPLRIILGRRKRRGLFHRRQRDGVPSHMTATLREGCACDLSIICELDIDYGRRLRLRVGKAGPEMLAHA